MKIEQEKQIYRMLFPAFFIGAFLIANYEFIGEIIGFIIYSISAVEIAKRTENFKWRGIK